MRYVYFYIQLLAGVNNYVHTYSEASTDYNIILNGITAIINIKKLHYRCLSINSCEAETMVIESHGYNGIDHSLIEVCFPPTCVT